MDQLISTSVIPHAVAEENIALHSISKCETKRGARVSAVRFIFICVHVCPAREQKRLVRRLTPSIRASRGSYP